MFDILVFSIIDAIVMISIADNAISLEGVRVGVDIPQKEASGKLF